MKRAALGLVALVVTALPAPGSATTLPTSNATQATLARALLSNAADTAVLDIPRGMVSLPMGDSDGDGIGDVGVIEHAASSEVVGTSKQRVKVSTVSGVLGEIRSQMKLLPGAEGAFPITIARTGVYVARDKPCMFVATNTFWSAETSLHCAGDGGWSTGSYFNRGARPAGAFAGQDLVVPLDVADVNGDGVSEILLGHYTGLGHSSGVGSWGLHLYMIDAAEHEIKARWFATGVGVAPGATFADLNRNLGTMVAVASGHLTADGIAAQVATYYPQSPFAVQIPNETWTTTLAASEHPIALDLRALKGTGWPDGGVVVSVVSEDRPSSSLQGSMTGPASIVGLGRGGLERFRVELPTASHLELLDLDGDASIDLRTTRVDLNSLVVESWSGAGTQALLGRHRMSFLEGDDYDKAIRVGAIGDVDGDGLPDLSIAGGFLCGPRMQVISRTTMLWELPELRSLFCDHGLTAAGPLDEAAGDDILEWRTLWACCGIGATPIRAEFRLRNGATGGLGWTTQIGEWRRIADAHGHPVGDIDGDGVSELLVVAAGDFTGIASLDGATGTVRTLADL